MKVTGGHSDYCDHKFGPLFIDCDTFKTEWRGAVLISSLLNMKLLINLTARSVSYGTYRCMCNVYTPVSYCWSRSLATAPGGGWSC